jgi:hypothetical protein
MGQGCGEDNRRQQIKEMVEREAVNKDEMGSVGSGLSSRTMIESQPVESQMLCIGSASYTSYRL